MEVTQLDTQLGQLPYIILIPILCNVFVFKKKMTSSTN